MNSRGGPPSGTERVPGVAVENRRRIKPAATRGIEKPSSIVIGSPAPRLVADPSPAKRGILDPLPIRERGPAQPHAEWPPTVSICPAGGKGAIGIQIGEHPNVDNGTCVMQRRTRDGRHAAQVAAD